MRSRFKEQCRIKRVTWSKVGLCVRAMAPKSGNIIPELVNLCRGWHASDESEVSHNTDTTYNSIQHVP